MRTVIILFSLLVMPAVLRPVYAGTPHFDTIDLGALIACASDSGSAHTERAETLVEHALSCGDPAVRVFCLYLAGEVMLARADTAGAREGFRDLVAWSAGDPFSDGDGVNGCVGAALWRLLRLLENGPPPDPRDLDGLMSLARPVVDSRSFFRITRPALLGSLPRLREDVLRMLVSLSWEAGLTDHACSFFMDYMSVLGREELTSTERAVFDTVVERGLASRAELLVRRAKRFQFLGRHAGAIEFLREAVEEGDAGSAAETKLLLARSLRIAGRSRPETIALLDGVIESTEDPGVIERAMLERAWTYGRAGAGRDTGEYRRGLLALADRFPDGSLADDALYELAVHHKDRGEDGPTLEVFDRLRGMTTGNDWINLAHYYSFIINYTRGGRENVRRAEEILLDLERLRPEGPMHPFALFWLGRIAEETDRPDEAAAWFTRAAEEAPRDWFGIRARMHLADGAEASAMAFPDSPVLSSMETACDAGNDTPVPRKETVYHVMLRRGIATGLYIHALGTEHRLREAFPSRRLEDIELDELSEAGLFCGVIALLSMRDAALAAVESVPDDDDNRIAVSFTVGGDAGDWPVAIGLAESGDSPAAVRRRISRHPCFPAAAYPRVYHEAILREAGALDVSPELLYAVMRRESLFHPEALSNRGALGLFQFMPSTFKVLDRRWELLRSSGAADAEHYLLDPQLSIHLGARWFSDELLARQDGNILFAVMEHNAGYPSVRRWKARWKDQGRDTDIEFMVETVPYGQTRIFARRVWADMVMADVVGVFAE